MKTALTRACEDLIFMGLRYDWGDIVDGAMTIKVTCPDSELSISTTRSTFRSHALSAEFMAKAALLFGKPIPEYWRKGNVVRRVANAEERAEHELYLARNVLLRISETGIDDAHKLSAAELVSIVRRIYSWKPDAQHRRVARLCKLALKNKEP
jgi:hypothetical protein